MMTVIFVGWLTVSIGLIIVESGVLLKDYLAGEDDVW